MENVDKELQLAQSERIKRIHAIWDNYKNLKYESPHLWNDCVIQDIRMYIISHSNLINPALFSDSIWNKLTSSEKVLIIQHSFNERSSNQSKKDLN